MDASILHDNAYYLMRQSARESAARSYPRRFPMAVVQAQGCHLTDADGRRYLDCLAGAGTLALGHNHPEITAVLCDVLQSGAPLHMLDMATPIKDRFTSDVMFRLPEGLRNAARLQFCAPSGSDAVEAAIKLAKTATGRSDVVAFRGGYHGMTQGALSLMGNLDPKAGLGALLPGSHFFPFPYAFRCPFGQGGAATERLCIDYLEQALRDPEGGINLPAAIIVEAVQGEGGVIEAPAAWLRALRRLTQELGIVLILDEVQSGIGRTGTFFAFQAAGIVPDVIVMSKAIGGGLPLAVVAYHERLDQWKPGAHAGTFRGNQLAMAAGSATMDIIARDGLADHAAQIGAYLMAGLRDLAARHPCIGQVRGRGLMIGVECVDPSGPRDATGVHPYGPQIAAQLQQAAFAHGLIVEKGGRFGSVLRLLPPLVLTREDADTILAVFEAILPQATFEVVP